MLSIKGQPFLLDARSSDARLLPSAAPSSCCPYAWLSQQLASHGLFDLDIRAEGDYHIDDHHTNEDVGLALGTVGGQGIPMQSNRSI